MQKESGVFTSKTVIEILPVGTGFIVPPDDFLIQSIEATFCL